MASHNEKMRMTRNILVSPDLELEMSGIEERGVKPPPIRLPGKTNLAGVLLNANPWEQRDLDRKLGVLNREQLQRERANLWAQRRFFMNRIFDSDLSLRFGNLEVERDRKSHTGGSLATGGDGFNGDSRVVSRTKSWASSNQRPGSTADSYQGEGMQRALTFLEPLHNNNMEDGDHPVRPRMYRSKTDLSQVRQKKKNTLGIFANPIPDNVRKFKVRSTTAGVQRTRRPTAKVKPTLAVSPEPQKGQGQASQGQADQCQADQGHGEGDCNNVTESQSQVTGSILSMPEKSKTAPQIFIHHQSTGYDYQSETPTLNSMTFSSSDDPSSSPRSRRRPRRDVSFRQDTAIINKNDLHEPPGNDLEAKVNECQVDVLNDTQNKATKSMHLASSRKSAIAVEKEIKQICDEEVIKNLTRTLPTALMLKANANLNAVINERKRKLMEESRAISTADSTMDERWLRLQDSLSPITPRYQNNEALDGLDALIALTNSGRSSGLNSTSGM